MALDTAANSMSTNVLRAVPSLLGKKFSDNASKKLSNLANEGASMLLNPMVESFLSFNLNNTTANVTATNANVTAHYNQNQNAENIFDQTLFSI